MAPQKTAEQLETDATRTGYRRVTSSVLGAHIDAMAWDAAMARLLGWARTRESRYVTICNVHVVGRM